MPSTSTTSQNASHVEVSLLFPNGSTGTKWRARGGANEEKKHTSNSETLIAVG
jgi:hypothetical protein